MNVNQAIYHCKVCNETPATTYRCDCDMGTQQPKKKPQQQFVPLPGIPEENRNDNTLRSMLMIPIEDLPGDFIGRIQAIDKIFRESDKK